MTSLFGNIRVRTPLRTAWPALAILSTLCLAAAPVAAQSALDHFMCYVVRGKNLAVPNILLQDEFDLLQGLVENVTVNRAVYFCNPVIKAHGGVITQITDINAHLKWYSITPKELVPTRTILVDNQFGDGQVIKLRQPRWLAVPARKDDHPLSQLLDHYKCYQASGAAVNAKVSLQDQFETDRDFTVYKPVRYCNPVRKTHNNVIFPVRNAEDRLVCYDVARPLSTQDQFGAENLFVRKMDLCVPSRWRPQG